MERRIFRCLRSNVGHIMLTCWYNVNVEEWQNLLLFSLLLSKINYYFNLLIPSGLNINISSSTQLKVVAHKH